MTSTQQSLTIGGVVIALIVAAYFLGDYTRGKKDEAIWAAAPEKIKYVTLPPVELPPVTGGSPIKPLPVTDAEKEKLREAVRALIANKDSLEERVLALSFPDERTIDLKSGDSVDVGQIEIQFTPLARFVFIDPWGWELRLKRQVVEKQILKTVTVKDPAWLEAVRVIGGVGLGYGLAKNDMRFVAGGGLVLGLSFTL